MSNQGSEIWRMARAGRITASRFADAIFMKEKVIQTQNKREGRERITEWIPSDARNTYMRDLIAELLSGEPKPEVNSASLSYGKEVEPYARAAYELETGLFVIESDFVVHPKYDFIGASPDGLTGSDGGIECKCPKDPQIHIKNMLEGMPEEHKGQVQGNMFVTGRKFWDFISFDPRQSEPYRLYVERVWRDDEYIAKLETGLLAFWEDVQAALAVIEQKVKEQSC